MESFIHKTERGRVLHIQSSPQNAFINDNLDKKLFFCFATNSSLRSMLIMIPQIKSF